MPKFNRGKNFIRATEMRSLSLEHKVNIVKCVKAMMNQIEISRKANPKDYENRLMISEKIFSLFMEYPELLSTNPKLRNVTEQKVNELINDLPRLNLNHSQVLDDTRYFLRMLQARSDYVEHNQMSITKLLEKKRPIHSYNLRPRNRK